MNIVRSVQAGTMQSSDLMVFVQPAAEISIDIESTVKKQFEHLIRAKVVEVLQRCQVQGAHIRITDRGALDYAIEARVETALRRAAMEG